MANTAYPQYLKRNHIYQERSEFKRRPQEGVRQDNSAPLRDRIASGEAYPLHQGTRPHPLSINPDRSKKRSTKRQTESITTWVRRPVRAEVDRIARRKGLTRSKVAGDLLEWAVNQKLHLQTAALIPSVIERSFDKVVGNRLARTDDLLVRTALEINQTRTLTTNVLGRQPGVDAGTLNNILDKSLDKAKEALTKRSPQMEEFIAAVVRDRQEERG